MKNLLIAAIALLFSGTVMGSSVHIEPGYFITPLEDAPPGHVLICVLDNQTPSNRENTANLLCYAEDVDYIRSKVTPCIGINGPTGAELVCNTIEASPGKPEKGEK